MIGGVGSFIASMQAAQQAMDHAKAEAMRNAYYERHADQIEAMRNALALQRRNVGNLSMAYQPYHRAKTFTDEALKLMDAEPAHREEIKAHALECLRQFPDQQVVAQFIARLLTA
jgi:uncharacterized SAM-dependent methyltransferase